MENEKSSFLYNTVCPKCRKEGRDVSGDNLGVYSDGHVNCWGCGYYKHGSVVSRSRLHSPTKPILVTLPEDSSVVYPERALKWVRQYGFTRKALLENNVLWSDKGVYINSKGEYTACNDLLIFPFWDKDHLQGWIGRYFGNNEAIPKWLTRGKMQDIYKIFPANNNKTIVLTEALLSAIKVQQAGHTAMPILGSHAKGRFNHLKLLGYNSVVLWLDPDKHIEMIKQSRVGSLEGLHIRVVLSTKKPKSHTIEEIREYLK